MKMTLTSMTLQIFFYKNNMMMLMLVVINCFMISTIMFMMSLSHWASFLIILIYISGIMVLFMFIVSLAPNEKNKVKSQKKIILFTLMSMLMIAQMKMINSEKMKVDSSYKMNIFLMILTVLLILSSAFIPPKVLILLYKGMKSTK